MRGLSVKSPWVDKILDGIKTWEIRGSRTSIRGTVALIRSGSGHVVGVVDLIESSDELTLEALQAAEDRTGFFARSLPYKRTHAWVLANPRRLDPPIPFTPKAGAVIWTTLDETTCNAIHSRLAQ